MEQKTEASQAVDERELLDNDGENRAVRTFLMQYNCDRSTTVGAMLAHMSRSGWRGYAPRFALDVRPESHLTKAGAQIWIRHLMSLEPAALKAQPAPTEAWTKQAPTLQADYWHWNGDEDAAPSIVSVLYSGSARKCFVTMNCTHSGQAEMCDKYGGWWMRIEQPGLPGEEAQSSGNFGELVQGEDSARLDAALIKAREWIVKNRPALTLSRAKTIDEYMGLLDTIDRARASAETGGVKS